MPTHSLHPATRAIAVLATLAIAVPLHSQEPCHGARMTEPDSVLIAGLADDTKPAFGQVQDELTCRAPVARLLAVFSHPVNDSQRARVLGILYHVDDPRVADALRLCMSPE